ncbi:hypothetical protein ABK040_012621 [Willaertia magna]
MTQPVNDEVLESISKALAKAKESLQVATAALRSCYSNVTETDEKIKEFVDLRGKVTNDVMVYRNKLLPVSRTCVENMITFFDYYKELSFDDWKECITDLASEARAYANEAEFLAKAHQVLLTDFKKHEDDCTRVLKKFEKEVREMNERAKQLDAKAGTTKSICSMFSFVPVLGQIVAGIGIIIGNKFGSEAEAERQNAMIAAAAAKAIKEDLMIALQHFIDAMKEIAGFFAILETEIRLFADQNEKFSEDPKPVHYKLLKSKSGNISKHCYEFIKIVPDCVSNLDAIKEPFDENYVQNWFHERQADNGKNLFDWGKELFAKRKNLADVFA